MNDDHWHRTSRISMLQKFNAADEAAAEPVPCITVARRLVKLSSPDASLGSLHGIVDAELRRVDIAPQFRRATRSNGLLRAACPVAPSGAAA
jgi:hypothetical protein